MSQFQPQQRGNSAPVGHVPLTWQMTCMVLLGIPLGIMALGCIASLFSTGQQGPAEVRFWHGWAWGITAVLAVLFGALWVSQRRRKHRQDLAPDLLAMHFDASIIYQAGPVHAVVLGFVRGDQVRVLAFVQNRYARPAEFRLHAGRTNQSVLTLYGVPASGVVLARVDIPLVVGLQAGGFRMQLYPSGSGGGGQLVRFAIRRAPTTAGHQLALTVTMAMMGHIAIPLSSRSDAPGPERQLQPLDPQSILQIAIPGARPQKNVPPIENFIGRLPHDDQVLWQPDKQFPADTFEKALLAAIEAPGRVIDIGAR